MIRTTAQAKRKARQLFRFCVINGRLDRHRARHVVSIVLKSRRRGYYLLLKEFERLVKLDSAAHGARIESAIPLPPLFQDIVTGKIQDTYGPATMSFAHDPHLIGGMRIRIGDDVYDGTVQAKLTKLKTSFGIRDG